MFKQLWGFGFDFARKVETGDLLVHIEKAKVIKVYCQKKNYSKPFNNKIQY